MKTLGNILWVILVGWWLSLSWLLVGCICCITILLIPVGLACFKIAKISFLPFNKEIVISSNTGSIIVNVVWILLFGLVLTIAHFVIGAALCVSIIGIPFGLQFFKIGKVSLLPCGAEIYEY